MVATIPTTITTTITTTTIQVITIRLRHLHTAQVITTDTSPITAQSIVPVA
jgi:hypothetical protein